MITIFDVAREAGVSKSTVSRVLNKEPGVKENTRLAVEAAIKKLNYSPSYFAKGIRTGKTKTIAMLVPEYTNVFYNEMFRGVEDVALEHGYMVLICNTERHANGEIEYTEELINRNVDGIIYNTYAIGEQYNQYLKEISDKLPVVFMNTMYGQENDFSYVVTDGFSATRDAVKYLYGRGRRKFGYLRNMESIRVTEDRYQGFLQGVKECGLTLQESFIYQAGFQQEPDYIKIGKDAADYYLSLQDRPDAILAVIDTLAIGCLQQMKRAGIHIPEEISMIGYDNIALSRFIEPALTTIAQPIRKLGQKAAEIVIAKINGEPTEDQVKFPGKLIVRDTTN